MEPVNQGENLAFGSNERYPPFIAIKKRKIKL